MDAKGMMLADAIETAIVLERHIKRLHKLLYALCVTNVVTLVLLFINTF